MIFRVLPLRFQFVARESIEFRPGSSANIIRGAVGTVFRRLVCRPECKGVALCESRTTCPYARIFEPAAVIRGPSGLKDWPRPFVFRTMQLDGETFCSGERFSFDVHLFDHQLATVNLFLSIFTRLAQEGLGPRRSKVALEQICAIDEFGQSGALVYEKQADRSELSGNDQLIKQPKALEFSLDANSNLVSRLRVRFLTPTEIKSQTADRSKPVFGVLAARIRDRISTLSQLYGEGPLPIDFREFGQCASHIVITGSSLKTVAIKRRSTKTGQSHLIGGFVGHAEYEGDLTEFLPYLRVAQWTGFGRQTVWGKGAIRVEEIDPTQEA